MTDTPEYRPDHIPEHVSKDANAWFLRLESDDLSPEEEAEFVAWLTESELHQTALAEAESVWQEMGGLKHAQMNEPEINEQEKQSSPQTVTHIDNARPRQSRNILNTHWLKGLAVAASILIAVLVSDNALLLIQADHITAIGERRTVSLEDGSQVILNTDSAVKLRFDDKQRLIELLKGEAYFKVAKDKERAFIVLANGVQTTALGTAFNIRMTDNGATVTVLEHSVAVAAHETGETVAELTSGQQMSGSSEQLGEVEQVDLRITDAWRKQRLIFKAKPLAEVILELNRYRKGRIIILDDEIASLKVTGVFSTQDPQATLKTIEKNLSLKALDIGPFLTMLDKG